MRIIVVGAGGVGGYFGAKLARSGQDVTLVARGAHLDAIRSRGLCIRSAVEGEYTVSVTAVENVEGLPPADAVLLCVKSFDTQAAIEQVRGVVGPATPVLSLQNGVDNEDKIDAALGAGSGGTGTAGSGGTGTVGSGGTGTVGSGGTGTVGSALGGVAYVFAALEAPGVIAHTFAGRIVLGELHGRPTPRAEGLRDALSAAGIPVALSDDIRRTLWEKYLLISAQAGMTGLTRCPIGVIRETPETWRMYRMIVEELAALGRASGIALPAGAVETTLSNSGQLAPHLYSSLHHDLIHGKRLELDALHGHAVRLGRRLGVPTPMVFAVYAALEPFAEGAR